MDGEIDRQIDGCTILILNRKTTLLHLKKKTIQKISFTVVTQTIPSVTSTAMQGAASSFRSNEGSVSCTSTCTTAGGQLEPNLNRQPFDQQLTAALPTEPKLR